MGYKYEVNVWDHAVDGHYYWVQIYAGGSLIKALYYLWWGRRQGWACIKLEYRP